MFDFCWYVSFRFRYSDLDPNLLNFENSCVHKSKKFKCMELLLPDIENFYNNEKDNKNSLDNKLAQMMNIKEIKRQRKRKNGKSHDFHTEFYVRLYLNKPNLSICSLLDYKMPCNVSLNVVFFTRRFGITARKSLFVKNYFRLFSIAGQEEFIRL